MVIELRARRAGKVEAGGRFVICAHCGERHPVVRLASGRRECPTAFEDTGHWFCRHRGCRAAYLGQEPLSR